MILLAFKIPHCLSVNHNSELRCVICTSVTLEVHCSQPIGIELFFHVYYYCKNPRQINRWHCYLLKYLMGFRNTGFD